MAHRDRDSSMETLGSNVLPPSTSINNGIRGPPAQAYPVMAPSPPLSILSQNKGHSAILRYPEWPPLPFRPRNTTLGGSWNAKA